LHVFGKWQIIGLPPALPLTLPDQFNEVITLGLVSHGVEVAQVTDIAQGSSPEAGFHPTNLARRAEQALRDLWGS
jgi:hypothetical protein